MNQRFASLLALVTGVLALRLTVTGEYLNYVRQGMFAWLLLSGMVLIVLGALGWMAARKSSEDHTAECSHGHSHGLSRAAWLLLFPVLVVGLIQPAPLGSFAANRQSSGPPRQSGAVDRLVQKAQDQGAPVRYQSLDELPLGDPAQPPDPAKTLPTPPPAGTAPAVKGGVPEMSLLDFLEITYYDETATLAGVPVRLVGFVMPATGSEDRGFLLSRFMINCCAADATIMQVGVKDVKEAIPAQDTWVSVTGRWYPGPPSSRFSPDGFPVPELVADKVEVIPAPENPYLSLGVS